MYTTFKIHFWLCLNGNFCYWQTIPSNEIERNICTIMSSIRCIIFSYDTRFFISTLNFSEKIINIVIFLLLIVQSISFIVSIQVKSSPSTPTILSRTDYTMQYAEYIRTQSISTFSVSCLQIKMIETALYNKTSGKYITKWGCSS